MEKMEFENIIFLALSSIFMDRLGLNDIEFDFEDIITARPIQYKICKENILKVRLIKEDE
jgi:hypothetical protein